MFLESFLASITFSIETISPNRREPIFLAEDGDGGVFGNLAQSQFLKNAWILSIAIEILLLNNYCMKFEPLIYVEKVGTNS